MTAMIAVIVLMLERWPLEARYCSGGAVERVYRRFRDLDCGYYLCRPGHCPHRSSQPQRNNHGPAGFNLRLAKNVKGDGFMICIFAKKEPPLLF